MEQYQEIIQQIVALREAKGLTQRDLAKLTDMMQPQIARMESLAVPAKLTTLIKVLDALDVKLAIIPKNTDPELIKQANNILIQYASILDIHIE